MEHDCDNKSKIRDYIMFKHLSYNKNIKLNKLYLRNKSEWQKLFESIELSLNNFTKYSGINKKIIMWFC